MMINYPAFLFHHLQELDHLIISRSLNSFIDKLWDIQIELESIGNDEFLTVDQAKMILGMPRKSLPTLEVDEILIFMGRALPDHEASIERLNKDISEQLDVGKLAHLKRDRENLIKLIYQYEFVLDWFEDEPVPNSGNPLIRIIK